jgi:hypothetical protein
VVVQLYLTKRDSDEPVTFAEIEQCLLAIDEKDFRDTQQCHQSLLTNANMASHHSSTTQSSNNNNENSFNPNKH